MGSYILSGPLGEDLDEQSVETFLEARQEVSFHPKLAPFLEKVEIHYSPVWLKGKQCFFLSARVIPKQWTRYAAIIALISGVIFAELLALIRPFLIGWIAHWSGFAHFLGMLGIGLLQGIAALSPAIILAPFICFCLLEELALKEQLASVGIEASILGPRNQWILFPGDIYILTGTASVLYVIQLLADFHALKIVSILYPIILFFTFMFILSINHICAYNALHDEKDLIYYWRLEVAKIFAKINGIFILPVCYFIFLSLSSHLGLSQTVIGTESFIDHIVNFRVSSLFPYGVGPKAAEFLSYYLTQPHGWDNSRLESFRMLLYSVWILPVCSFFYVAFTRKYLGFLNIERWEMFDLLPVPSDNAANKTPRRRRRIDIAILLEWLIISLLKWISISLIVIGLLTVFHAPFIEWWSAGVPVIVPFVWYETSFQVVLGTLAGTIVARVILIVLFFPALIWLCMWFFSFCSLFCKSLYCRLQNKNVSEVHKLVNALCQSAHLHPPLVNIENTSTKGTFPVTNVLFPDKRCVIHYSPALVDVLEPDDLRLIVAHELGHVVKHSRKIWWAQMLSCLSINGIGYLTLLLDYWQMEIEADAYAVRITKDCSGLISLLRRYHTIEGEIMKRQREQARKEGKHDQNTNILYSHFARNKTIMQVKKAFHLYFATTLWGPIHPNIDERLDNLNNLSDFESTDIQPVKKHEAGQQPASEGTTVNRDGFTVGLRKVLNFAQEEAQRFQHNYVGTEHLLLGLLCEGEGVAAVALTNLGVELNKARSVIELIIGRGNRIAFGEIGLNPQANRVIELADEEARRMDEYFTGTEHLLLGLVRDGDGIVAGILENLGVDLEKVHRATRETLMAQEKYWSQRSMRCELCRKNPPYVRTGELIDGRYVRHFFCESCVDELMRAAIQEEGIFGGQGMPDEESQGSSETREEKQVKGMRCEGCRKNPAYVRVKQLIDGRHVCHFYCQSCVDGLMKAALQEEGVFGGQGIPDGENQEFPETRQEEKED